MIVISKKMAKSLSKLLTIMNVKNQELDELKENFFLVWALYGNKSGFLEYCDEFDFLINNANTALDLYFSASMNAIKIKHFNDAFEADCWK